MDRAEIVSQYLLASESSELLPILSECSECRLGNLVVVLCDFYTNLIVLPPLPRKMYPTPSLWDEPNEITMSR